MVTIKDIPTLTGEAAEKFVKKLEENNLKAGSVDFTEQAKNSRAILMKWKKADR